MFRKPPATLLIFTAIVASGLVTGCSAFMASKRIDVAPYSENTIGMVGALQKLDRPAMWTRLKKYDTLPSIAEVRGAIAPVRELMRAIALYSTQVVALHDSPLPEQVKVIELARYVEEYIRPGLPPATSEFHLSSGYLDTLVADIRSRKTLLSGLDAVQPLVNLTLSAGDILFDRLDVKVRAAYVEISSRIEGDFGPVTARMHELDSMQVAIIRSYTLLQQLRGGDKVAFDSLRARDPALLRYLTAGGASTAAQLDDAERNVIERTETVRAFRAQLESEFAKYQECQAELEGLRNRTDERAQLGRATLSIWGRSHRNLAAGVSVAPMIDVAGVMRGKVGTVLQSTLP